MGGAGRAALLLARITDKDLIENVKEDLLQYFHDKGLHRLFFRKRRALVLAGVNHLPPIYIIRGKYLPISS